MFREYSSSYGNRFQDWIDEVITGAQATALVILYAREGKEPNRIAREIEQMFDYDLSTYGLAAPGGL